MMKKEKSPGFKKVKLLIALPVIAILIFAFAKPEYVVNQDEGEVVITNEMQVNQEDLVSQTSNDFIRIKGKIVGDNVIPMTGANVVLKGTNIGTVVDWQGEFELETPREFTLVVSYVGYETTQGSFVSKSGESMGVMMNMKKGTFNIKLPDVSGENVKMQAPPPPPPIVSEADKDKVFTVVEEMPYYSNGGMTRLALDIKAESESIISKTKDRGEVVVGFTVSSNGSIENTKVVKGSKSDILNESAVKIITKLNNWNPGIQRGKKVPVDLTVPVKFE